MPASLLEIDTAIESNIASINMKTPFLFNSGEYFPIFQIINKIIATLKIFQLWWNLWVKELQNYEVSYLNLIYNKTL